MLKSVYDFASQLSAANGALEKEEVIQKYNKDLHAASKAQTRAYHKRQPHIDLRLISEQIACSKQGKSKCDAASDCAWEPSPKGDAKPCERSKAWLNRLVNELDVYGTPEYYERYQDIDGGRSILYPVGMDSAVLDDFCGITNLHPVLGEERKDTWTRVQRLALPDISAKATRALLRETKFSSIVKNVYFQFLDYDDSSAMMKSSVGTQLALLYMMAKVKILEMEQNFSRHALENFHDSLLSIDAPFNLKLQQVKLFFNKPPTLLQAGMSFMKPLITSPLWSSTKSVAAARLNGRTVQKPSSFLMNAFMITAGLTIASAGMPTGAAGQALVVPGSVANRDMSLGRYGQPLSTVSTTFDITSKGVDHLRSLQTNELGVVQQYCDTILDIRSAQPFPYVVTEDEIIEACSNLSDEYSSNIVAVASTNVQAKMNPMSSSVVVAYDKVASTNQLLAAVTLDAARLQLMRDADVDTMARTHSSLKLVEYGRETVREIQSRLADRVIIGRDVSSGEQSALEEALSQTQHILGIIGLDTNTDVTSHVKNLINTSLFFDKDALSASLAVERIENELDTRTTQIRASLNLLTQSLTYGNTDLYATDPSIGMIQSIQNIVASNIPDADMFDIKSALVNRVQKVVDDVSSRFNGHPHVKQTAAMYIAPDGTLNIPDLKPMTIANLLADERTRYSAAFVKLLDAKMSKSDVKTSIDVLFDSMYSFTFDLLMKQSGTIPVMQSRHDMIEEEKLFWTAEFGPVLRKHLPNPHHLTTYDFFDPSDSRIERVYLPKIKYASDIIEIEKQRLATKCDVELKRLAAKAEANARAASLVSQEATAVVSRDVASIISVQEEMQKVGDKFDVLSAKLDDASNKADSDAKSNTHLLTNIYSNSKATLSMMFAAALVAYAVHAYKPIALITATKRGVKRH